MTVSIACHDCSMPTHGSNPDLLKLGSIKYGLSLCQHCYGKRRTTEQANASGVRTKTCSRGHTFTAAAGCPSCRVVDGLGADMFECDCGVQVPMEDTLRVMRKSAGRIERMCRQCSSDGSCGGDRHSIVTANHRDWDPSKFTFAPVPENLQVGYCSRCGLQLYWDKERWIRMDWEALATAWEAVPT